MIVEIFVFFVLLFVSAFFSASETALFSLQTTQLVYIEEHHSKSYRYVERLLRNPRELLITILVGNDVVNIAASSIITDIFLKIWGSLSVALSIGIMTLVLLIFCETTPKSLAMRSNVFISTRVAKLIYYFGYLISPAKYAFYFFSKGMDVVLAKKSEEQPLKLGEEEFKELVKMSRGVVDKEEEEMIQRTFRWEEVKVKDIMIPLQDVEAFSAHLTLEDVLKRIKSIYYSRIPVYEGTKENIIGILYQKDLFLLKFVKDKKRKSLKEISRPALFISLHASANEAFRFLNTKKVHLAVVKEGKKCLGIVTMEDILEELFGEFRKVEGK